MKIIFLFFILTANLFAMEIDKDLFKGAELAAKYQCSDKISDYKFDAEFAILYQFDDRDKIDYRKLKDVTDSVFNSMLESCKTKKYLAGGWDFQGCLNKCSDVYKKDDLTKFKCLTTCSSLKAKTESLVDVFGRSVSKKIIFAQDKCKNESSLSINSSGREKIKKITDDKSNSTEKLNKTIDQ